jgi:hypothetical protein
MKNCILYIFFSLILGATLAHGATVNIGPGESIQTAINNASAGDVLNLAAPVDYNGDLNITKPLRIIGLRNENQSLEGNIYIQGIPSGQGVYLNSINVVGALTVKDSNLVTLKDLNVTGSVDANNSSLNILKSYFTSTFTALNPSNANTQLNFVQSSIKQKLTSKLTRTWVGYSDLVHTAFEGVVELVGNDFNGGGRAGIGIDLNGTHTFANIHNNLVHHYAVHANWSMSNACIGIWIRGNARSEIRNNSIWNNYDSNHDGTESNVGVGVYVESTAGTLIASNLITKNYVSRGTQTGNAQVCAPKENVVMRNNALDRNPSNTPELVKGGAEHYDTISDTAEGTGFLHNTVGRMDGKAGQDKGSPHDYHKDHDGSRNDIGANGGRNYIPDGRTTNKPIPIFFSLAPQAVPIGGTVTIESIGATVK